MSDIRRFRISHITTLGYSAPVTASHNELRMTPVTEAGQLTLEHRLRIRPMTWSHVFQDYWGSHVTAIDVSGGHERLEVESLSTVERMEQVEPSGGLSLADLNDDAVRDVQFEWLGTQGPTQLSEEALALVDGPAHGRSVAALARAVFEAVSGHLSYRPGATAVHSTAQDAWVEGAGVCQDYAHAAVAMLRAHGVPARYVSGYLAPKRDSRVGETSSGESHAWLEWWDGAWHAWDVTNMRPVGLDHVVVARGRDYRDVPPLVGVFSGAAQSMLSVEVTFTRLR